MVNDDLYAALSPLFPDGRVFDTKLPDDYAITDVTVAYSLISDTPDLAIDGTIVDSAQRWQVSIYSPSLTAARTARNTVVQALHGLTGNTIQRCDYESAPGELYDATVIPPVYHIPVDFLIWF